MSLAQRLLLVFVLLGVCSASTLSASGKDSGTASTSSEQNELFKLLRTAASETEGRYAEDAVWQFWFNQAPTQQVRDSLDASIKRREESKSIHTISTR